MRHDIPKCAFNMTNISLKTGDTALFGSKQVYTFINQTGNVVKWRSSCKVCGTPFECTTGAGVIGGVNRHCEEHKARKATEEIPLVHLDKKERQSVMQELWDKHTKDGVTDRKAYLLALNEYDRGAILNL